MKSSLARTLGIFLLSAAMPLAATAQYADKTPAASDAQIEAVVKKVIEEHPELIVKSVEAYQLREQAAVASKAAQKLISEQKDLQQNPHSPVYGNPNGDVTVVEFFDYHCGYCKHFFPIIKTLTEEDKNVRVVFKEFPILSEDSALAAKGALAVYSLDKTKYFAYHAALMKYSGRFSTDVLSEKAKEVGIDPAAFKKAMESPELEKELDHNKQLAAELNISGTPVVVVGTELIPGAIELSTLKSKVAMARQAQKEHRS